MADTNDEKYIQLVENYIRARKKCEKALQWYQNASEKEKEKIRYSGESIEYALSRGFYGIGWRLENQVSQEIGEVPDYIETPDFAQLYIELYNAISELDNYDRNTSEPKIEENEETDDSFLDVTLEGAHTDSIAETSILNDYRNWGIERICLDGFQNHLPEDSKGTKSYLQFFIGDRWINYDEAFEEYNEEQLKSGIIKEVRFADDGVGFEKGNIAFLSSQKSSEDLSVGQFGEGLKLVAMAAVNLGLEMEVQSRNWRAKATGRDIEMRNYRDTQGGEQIDRKRQLVWEVSEYNTEIKRI